MCSLVLTSHCAAFSGHKYAPLLPFIVIPFVLLAQLHNYCMHEFLRGRGGGSMVHVGSTNWYWYSSTVTF